MAGKARVHELAKELHVTSKEILARLSDQGEFAKSASSTIAAPVARRLRASYNNDDDQDHKSARTGQDQPARPDNGSNTAPKRPVKTEQTARRRDTPAMPRPQLTEAQNAAICQSYRQLYINAPDLGNALEKISAKYAAEYGVTRAAIRKIVMADKRRHGADYAAMDKKRRTTDYAALRNLSQQIQHQKREERRPAKPPLPATEQTPGTAAQPALSRARTSGLPASTTNLDVASCAEIVLDKNANQDCVTDLQKFDPAAHDYGYLAWRYSTVHQRLHREPPETTAAEQLAAIARAVDSDRTQLDLMQAGGDILEHPGAAKHILEREHHDLIDTDDDVAGSPDDERRHIREKETFLHRAVLLLIAAPHLADRLWQILDTLAPRPRDQLIQDSPALSAALDRFRAHIAAVEALLSTDETTITRFLDRSHTELADLQAGRYDYLRAYRDLAPAGAAHRDTEELPFVVLPPGEALRNFLASLRSKAGRHFDQNRVNVLDDLEHHFGAHRCRWHHGSTDSRGINNRYLILTIASGDGEHAVAISPLAGEHATYVVRHDYCQDPWTVVLAGSKIRARRRGARRLPFTTSASSTDQYTAMRQRIIALLEIENPTT